MSGAPYDQELDSATAALDARLEAAEDPEEVNRLETWLWLDGPAQDEGGARSEEIPGAAHLPYLERPEAVAG